MSETDIHILVVINNHAGSGLAEKVYSEYFKFLQDHQISFFPYYTVGKADPENIEKLINSKNFNTVSILGGDGTINSVINARGVEALKIHLIPCGTGNDLVHTLLGKKTITSYFKQVTNERTVEIDMYKCNNKRFLVSFGIGFDGAVCEKVELMRKKRIPKAFAYWSAIFSILFNYPNLEVEIDGKKTALFLFSLANNDRFGGGFIIAPNARLDDQLIEYVLVRATTVKQRLLNILKLKAGKHLGLSIVEYKRVKSCSIHAPKEIPAHVDGELMYNNNYTIQFDNKLKICV